MTNKTNTSQSLQIAQETASTAKVEYSDAGAKIKALQGELRKRLSCGDCEHYKPKTIKEPESCFDGRCKVTYMLADSQEKENCIKFKPNDRIAALLGESE